MAAEVDSNARQRWEHWPVITICPYLMNGGLKREDMACIALAFGKRSTHTFPSFAEPGTFGYVEELPRYVTSVIGAPAASIPTTPVAPIGRPSEASAAPKRSLSVKLEPAIQSRIS